MKDINLLNWVKKLSVYPALSGLHAIYMDDSDSVLLHTALTGIRPFESFTTESCMAYNPQRIINTASIIGADRIFLFIHHPTGPLIPSSGERNLAVNGQEHLGALFKGVIISGSKSYTIINGSGDFETNKISEGDSAVVKALKRFRYIQENHSLFSILLGSNEENRIVFWSFNKSDYPYELYHKVIEALEGTSEYILRPYPSAWEKIGDFQNPLYPEQLKYSLKSLDTPFCGYQRTVIVNSIEESDGQMILCYRSLKDPSLHNSPIRNPEQLCGRLLTGSEIEIIEQGKNEVTLLLEEEDLIPEDMIIHFKGFVPRYKTYFGVVTEPDNNRGKYCSLINIEEDSFTVCIGEYEIKGDTGFCHREFGNWKVRHGLIERYLYNRVWFNKCPVNKWEHEYLNVSDTLDFLTVDKLNRKFREYIVKRAYFEDFLSDQWTPSFFRKQAKLGFIASTAEIEDTNRLKLQLPESHTWLDWEKLHIDRNVRTILRKRKEKQIILRIERDPETVLENLLYVWKDSLWISEEYIDLIRKLSVQEEQEKDKQFAIWGVSLLVGEEKIPVAGELGYTIGKTFTSLAGFFRRDLKKYNNFGKLQMIMLAAVLEKEGFAFWNMSHPNIQQKSDLIGGRTSYDRKYFLRKWDNGIDCDTPDLRGDTRLYKDLEVECMDGYDYEYDYRPTAHNGKIVLYKEQKKSMDQNNNGLDIMKWINDAQEQASLEMVKVYDEIEKYENLIAKYPPEESDLEGSGELELVSEYVILEELKEQYKQLKEKHPHIE